MKLDKASETSPDMAQAMPMGDSHRRFLQTMMSYGLVDEVETRKIYKHCCETHNGTYSPDRMDPFIDVVNSQLQPLFMQIRKGMSEEDGLQYYALIYKLTKCLLCIWDWGPHIEIQVNLAKTDITRMSSDYADNELELFRKTMDLIVGSDDGTASSTDILNSTDSMQTKKLKKSDTEHLLSRLVQDKWLSQRQGFYTLSTRCIIEMEPYIRTMYQDQVKVCQICHNIVLQCQSCDSPTCGVKMHNPCVARYFKGRAEPRCPACEEFWPHEIPELRRPSQSKPER